MALVDTKAITRMVSISDMGALVYAMKHPHPIIKVTALTHLWGIHSLLTRR